MVSDGPHGLRAQLKEADHVGLSGSEPATCFPTASGIGSSWNSDLFAEVGEALGREASRLKISVILGPGINIKRSPLCGRNFEYVSEDPYLSGALATAMVKGIQSQGIGTSVKHYAANNQEDDRLRVSAEVDERTLREIYLPAFEAVVKESQPVDGDVRVQQDQRHVRLRAPLAADRGAPRRVGLRRGRGVGLGCGARSGRGAGRRAGPGDAAESRGQRSGGDRGGALRRAGRGGAGRDRTADAAAGRAGSAGPGRSGDRGLRRPSRPGPAGGRGVGGVAEERRRRPAAAARRRAARWR